MSQAIDKLAVALQMAANTRQNDVYLSSLLKLAADTLVRQEQMIEANTQVTDKIIQTLNFVIGETKGVQ